MANGKPILMTGLLPNSGMIGLLTKALLLSEDLARKMLKSSQGKDSKQAH